MVKRTEREESKYGREVRRRGGSTKWEKDTGGCYNTYQNNNATTSSLLLRLRSLLLSELVEDGEGLVDLGVH